jgi:hypothetical protein
MSNANDSENDISNPFTDDELVDAEFSFDSDDEKEKQSNKIIPRSEKLFINKNKDKKDKLTNPPTKFLGKKRDQPTESNGDGKKAAKKRKNNEDDEPIAISPTHIDKIVEDNKKPKKNLIIKEKEPPKKRLVIHNSDKEIFAEIDDIVDSFCESFPDYPKDDILNALKATSFNLQNTYICIKYPEVVRSKIKV